MFVYHIPRQDLLLRARVGLYSLLCLLSLDLWYYTIALTLNSSLSRDILPIVAEGENRITQINYDPRNKYLLATSIFVALGLVLRYADGKDSTGHLFLIPSIASLREAVLNDRDIVGDMALGASGSVILEAVQAIYPRLGNAELGDLVIDAIGIPIWIAFENAAKDLHDSGFTDPIYNLLGIKKRRK